MIDRGGVRSGRGGRNVLVVVVSVLLAVAGAGTASAEPAPDEPPAETPPAETAPPPEVPDTGTVPDDPDEDGSSGDFPWGILLAVGIGVVLVAAFVSWSSGRSARRRSAAVTSSRQLDAIVSRGRWAVDHGVYAVLQAPDPATRVSSWVALDAQLRSIEAEIGRVSGPFDSSVARALARLGTAIAAMRGTLAGAFERRTGTGEPIVESTIAESVARSTLARRDEVESALRELELVRG